MTFNRGGRGLYVKVKTAKKRPNSSSRWLSRQLNDPYVRAAKEEGYFSRAAFKLLDINEKTSLFQKGMSVVDLGAAPGGWSQVAARIVQSDKQDSKNKIIAVDLLAMQPIAGVETIIGDFSQESVKDKIMKLLGDQKVDVVMSDMASNTTGHRVTDHLRIMVLCEAAFDFAIAVLKPGGHFITKIFHGGNQDEFLTEVKKQFKTIKYVKPPSSRQESSEFYLVALHKK